MIRDLTKTQSKCADTVRVLADIMTLLDGREEEYHCIDVRIRQAYFSASCENKEITSIYNHLLNHITKYGNTANNDRTEAKGAGDGN